MEHRDSPEAAAPPAHTDAQARREALGRYRILNTGPERDFDRVTRLVAQTCGVPTALITLLDGEQQWFKSCYGYDGARASESRGSFAAHAARGRDTLVVEDASEDPRFRSNPFVTRERGWRFYAGAPLITPEGVAIGTLCIVDYEPRVFDASHRAILEDLADVVVSQFERRRDGAQSRRYERLIENMQEVVFETDLEGNVTFLNAAWGELTGFSVDEALGDSLLQFVHPKDRVKSLQAFAPLLKQEQRLLRHETRFRTRSGDVRPMEFRARLITDGDGTPAGTVGTLAPLPPAALASDPLPEARPAMPEQAEVEEAQAEAKPAEAEPDEEKPDEEKPDEVAPEETPAASEETSPEAPPPSAEASAKEEEANEAGLQENDPLEEPPPLPPSPAETDAEAPPAAASGEAEAGAVPWPDREAPEAAPASEDAGGRGEEETGEEAGNLSVEEELFGGLEEGAGDAASPEDRGFSSETLYSVDEQREAAGEENADSTGEALEDAVAQGFPGLEELGRATAFSEGETLNDVRARLSKNPPDLRHASIDYAEHLRTTLDELEPAARRKGLTMHRALPDDGLDIRADGGALRLLVAALVNNAIASTDEGSITVSGRADYDSDGVRLRVVDTGADISRSLLNSLLNVDIGDDDDEPDEERHLAFVHRLVHLMQGAVEMESQRGRGTVFTVTLPWDPEEEDDEPPARPAQAGGAAFSRGEQRSSEGDGADEQPARPPDDWSDWGASADAPADDENDGTDGEASEPFPWETDSIFDTGPPPDPDAEDEPDAFRTDPDSPFSF